VQGSDVSRSTPYIQVLQLYVECDSYVVHKVKDCVLKLKHLVICLTDSNALFLVVIFNFKILFVSLVSC
jgi:hypothetical protein